MSKSHLPTQKDGELFPQEMQQPTVTRVVGIDTRTPEGAAALAARAGEINRFVTAARQHYSLNGQQQLAVRRPIRDGEVRYLNQGGNELVEIRVELPKGAPKGQPKRYWDWAMIDVVIPDPSEFTYSAAAYVIVPIMEPVTPSSTPPWPGVAVDADVRGSNSDGVCVAYPSVDDIAAISSGDTSWVSSLRVDLRTFRGFNVAEIDLYGALASTVTTPIPYRYVRAEDSRVTSQEFVASSTYTFVSPGPGDTWTPPLSDVYALGGGSTTNDHNADTTSVFVVDAPLVPDSFDSGVPQFKQEYVYDSTSGLMTEVVFHGIHPYYSGVQQTAPFVDGRTYDFMDDIVTYSYHIELETQPESVPITRDAEVRGGLYQGTPPWIVAEEPFSGPEAWLPPVRWDIADHTPRDTGTLMANVTLDSTTPVDGTIDTHYGKQYLGRITIDLEHGAASFKPA